MIRQLAALAGLTILTAGAVVLLPSASAYASCDPAINNPLWMGNSPAAGTYTSDLQTWDADCPGS